LIRIPLIAKPSHGSSLVSAALLSIKTGQSAEFANLIAWEQARSLDSTAPFFLTAMLFRLILLLAIAGGLTIFALSNGSTLALSFLGMPTPTLPLALWVLGAIAAGVMTHGLIVALFRLSNLLAVTEVRSQLRRDRGRESNPSRPGQRRAANSNDDSDWQNWDRYEEPVDRPADDRFADDRPPTSSKTSVKPSPPIDDWEGDFKDEWDDEPRPRPQPAPRPSTPTPTAYNYAPPQPSSRTVDRSTDRSTNQATDGSVVDANFRVLVPPTRPTPPPPPQPDNADDWFDDDDLETDEQRRRRLGL
jgi:uncharacterized integral membrane protein